MFDIHFFRGCFGDAGKAYVLSFDKGWWNPIKVRLRNGNNRA
jgi:hypothetical protein